MSSSGGRGRQQGRVTQMQEQEGWLARKKAEIEMKRKMKESAEDERKARKDADAAAERHSAAKKKCAFKNRWGFKGKDDKSSGESSSKMQFSNDGSFLEQFKKMQQQKVQEKKVEPKMESPTEVKVQPKVEPVEVVEKPKVQPKVEHKAKKAVPKPNIETLKEETQSMTQSAQEDEWYKEALQKAREIAQKAVQEATSPDKLAPVEDTAVKTETVSPLACTPSTSSPGASAIPSSSKAFKNENFELPTVVDELASLVAVNGDQVEVMVRERNMEEEELIFLQDVESELFQRYRARVETLRQGFREEGRRARKRTRWGSEDEKVVVPPGAATNPQLIGKSPELIAYAMKVYGSVDLEDHQWKQCSDQMKMSLVYQDLLAMQVKMEQASAGGKRKYEYDSDEDTEGGTWEHRARKLEMEKTSTEANKLTEEAAGKHHIGDFLPPEELNKFLAKYEAVKNGGVYEESDYQENQITDNNMGFKMLQKMGWNEGSGLGANAQGITKPVNQGNQSSDKKGLGIAKPHDLETDDNEFDAYRKRMMLAYRFRPNPLNNPRRSYY